MAGIRVELQLQEGQFTSGLLRAGQSLREFQAELARTDRTYKRLSQSGKDVIVGASAIERSHRTLLGTLRDLSIVAGGLGMAFDALAGSGNSLLGSIIKINSDMERLRFQMMAMSTAVDPMREAEEAVAGLRREATQVPFSLREISTTFTKLRAAGIDPTTGAFRALTDGIAAFGGTDEDLHRVTLGITQMYGKSVIQMEEMRQQLGETMPNAMRLMARSMGVSVQQLTEAIGTGRLAAKPALDAFYAELDRTYGGSAQRMMQTFIGQVTLVKANLQQLATGTGLSDFVNVTLKGLATGFNEFLQGADAKAFADAFGNSLSTLANVMSTVVQITWGFRNELGTLALALGGILIVNRTKAAIESFGQALMLMKLNMGQSIAMWRQAGESFALARLAIAGAGTAAEATAFRMAGLGLSIRAVGVAIWTALPHLAALGVAITIAASTFGVFTRSGNEAYETLQKFGAESREQAMQAIQDQRTVLEAQIAAAQEKQRLAEELGQGFEPGTPEAMTYGADADAAAAEVSALRAQLASLRADSDAIMAMSADREDQIAMGRMQSLIERRRQELQTGYRREMEEIDANHEEQLRAAAENGASILQVDERFNALRKQEMMDLAEGQLQILNDQKAAEEALLQNATPLQAEAVNARLNWLFEQIQAAEEALDRAKNWVPGLEMGADLDSANELLSAGQTALNQLESKVADLRAELEGGTTEVEKMQSLLDQGVFGSYDQNGEEFTKLKDALLAAAAAKDELDERMARRDVLKPLTETINDLQGEIGDAEMKLAGMDDIYEQILWRMNNGEWGFANDAVPELDKLKIKLLTVAAKLRDLNQQLKDMEGFKKGQADIKAMAGEVLDAIAIFGGAGQAATEMRRAIADGEYGSLDDASDSARRLRDALVDVADAQDDLNKAMEAERRLHEDVRQALTSSLEQAAEARAKLAGEDYSELDRIQNRIRSGYYAGRMEIDQVRGAITTVVQAMITQGTTANDVGRVLRENAFGDTTQSAITTTTSNLQKLSQVLTLIAQTGSGMNMAWLPGTDANGLMTSGLAGLPGAQASAEAVVNGLMARGLPQHIAQGFAANFKVESNFDASNQTGDGGNAWGLAQWNDRRDDLIAYAQATGRAWNDIETQLDFVIHELKGSESNAWTGYGGRRGISSATNAEDAARLISVMYERPGTPHMEARVGAAREYAAAGLGTGVPVGALAPTGAATPVVITADETSGTEAEAIRAAVLERNPDYERFMEEAWDGLHPFKEGEDTPLDLGNGQIATEFSETDEVEGGYRNRPSIWFDTAGNPYLLAGELGAEMADAFEERTGQLFPRFATEADAIAAATARSAAGGGTSGTPTAGSAEPFVFDATGAQEQIDGLLTPFEESSRQLEIELGKLKDALVAQGLLEDALKLQEFMDGIAASTTDARRESEGLGDNYRRLLEMIESGELDSTDPTDPIYADAIKAAQRADAYEEQLKHDEDLRDDIQSASESLAENRREMDAKLAEMTAKLADPNYIPDPREIREAEQAMKDYLKSVEDLYGLDSEQYRSAEASAQAYIDGQQRLAGMDLSMDMQEQTREAQDAVLTERQTREKAFRDAMAEIDARADAMRRAGMDEVEITRQVEAAKAAIRAQYEAQDPVAKAWADLRDIRGQLDQTVVGFGQGLGDAIGNALRGEKEQGWKALLNSTLDGLANIAGNFFSSMIMQGMGGMMRMGAGAGGGGGFLNTILSLGASLFGAPVAHTGGIVGASGLSSRQVSASVFAGAPRYHTGGIVGTRLMPGEQPIIAQDGEGVFTREQMKALGGNVSSRSVTVQAPITIHGSAGTPQQNQDLAQRMSRELAATLDQKIATGIQKQLRPGNMLAR